MTGSQSPTPPAGTPAPSVPDAVARRAAELAAEGRAVFDASFEPPRAPRTIGVNV